MQSKRSLWAWNCRRVKWWSPAGLKNYHASTDVREGGEFRYCFESSEGVRNWGKGVYQTINEPTYLSYIDNFSLMERRFRLPTTEFRAMYRFRLWSSLYLPRKATKQT